METLLRWLLLMIQPLTLVWLLLGLWLAQTMWRRLWRWSALPAAAWLILTLITCTPLVSLLLRGMESRYPLPEMADVDGAEAIVCLGGGTQASQVEPTGLRLVRGANRVSTALSMAAAEMAPVLVLGGGGTQINGEALSEADAIIAFLERFPELGFEAISLGICANTRDEALKVAKLVQERGWEKVLLVTSASHMPRSVATFAKVGVKVVPVPCHYLSRFSQGKDVKWLHLPDYGNLELFDSWFHEYIGTWIYHWRGWM